MLIKHKHLTEPNYQLTSYRHKTSFGSWSLIVRNRNQSTAMQNITTKAID